MSVDNDYKEKILDLLKTILNISDEINKKNLNNKHKEWDSLGQLSIVFALEEEEHGFLISLLVLRKSRSLTCFFFLFFALVFLVFGLVFF